MSLEQLPTVTATLASAAAHLPPDATISARTLSQDACAPRKSDQAADSLPRIPLGGSPGGPEPGGADLDLSRMLGEGGLGRVMLARQRSIGRDVAVKVARNGADGGSALRVEARTMGRLEHPNVVPVHAIGVDEDGGVVLVMKYIEGVEWRTLLRDPAAPWWDRLEIPPAERAAFHLDVLAQIANALHYAHGRGVIHRDVKPENVLIGAHGDVYLADWGVASLPDQRRPDAPSTIVGTPAYMAPEMVLGDPMQITPQTDVFLLGATLHEILTGEARHAGATVAEALSSAYACEPFAYADGVPDELAALARAATARDPAARPESAMAFRRALDAWRAHRGTIGLVERAREIATEARKLRDERGAEALAEVDRMLIEARFGFTQALREWPENAAARQGLRDVLVLAVESELARESVHTVRARLLDIDDPPPALVAAVEALEAKEARDRLERERLEALERDRDLSVASSERRAFFGLVLAMGALVATLALTRRALTGRRADDPASLAAISGIVMVVAIGFALAMRRRRAQNTAGASLLLVILTAMGTVLANRVLGALAGTPTHAMLATDLLIYAGVLVGMRLLVPRVAWVAVSLVAGAAACTVLAGYATFAFALTMLGSLAALYVGWHWFMQPASATRPDPSEVDRDGALADDAHEAR